LPCWLMKSFSNIRKFTWPESKFLRIAQKNLYIWFVGS
jgi:hypothetical protein